MNSAASNHERVEVKELPPPSLQLSLLHPLGTMNHRVIEGDLKENKQIY
jgi:hypothetical protein